MRPRYSEIKGIANFFHLVKSDFSVSADVHLSVPPGGSTKNFSIAPRTDLLRWSEKICAPVHLSARREISALTLVQIDFFELKKSDESSRTYLVSWSQNRGFFRHRYDKKTDAL